MPARVAARRADRPSTDGKLTIFGVMHGRQHRSDQRKRDDRDQRPFERAVPDNRQRDDGRNRHADAPARQRVRKFRRHCSLRAEGAMPAKDTVATVISCMRYRDAPAAIDWLQRAFGFEPQLVVPDAHGGIAHAQLRFGNGMAMLGSLRDDEFGKLMTHPDQTGGRETQSAYLIVDDADAAYAKAKAAGATIVMDIKDEDYGGRGFSCRDLEGHLWNFGTYDPWTEPQA